MSYPLAILSLAGAWTAQERWTSRGPALEGAWADADVVEAEPGEWWMLVGVQPESARGRLDVYVARSTDGTRWDVEGEPVLRQATFPDAVRLPDGRMRLYFQRRGEICSATSTRGTRFEDDPGVRIPRGGERATDGTAAPTVWRRPDGSWLMVYRGDVRERWTDEALNPTTTALLASDSPDGIEFGEGRLLVDSRNRRFGGYVDGCELVAMDDGDLHLFFWTCSLRGNDREAGIYEMISEDSGRSWREPRLAVPRRRQGTTNWGDPTVARIDGEWRMYYGQRDGIHMAVLAPGR